MNKKFNFRFSKDDLCKFSGSADEAVSGLEQGGQIMGMTMGNFSLIDLIYSTLKKVGAADLYIATWSAGIKDAHQVKWMIDTNLIRGVRLLTDHSYVNRQKKYAMSIEQLFGKENIRTSEMHAKFVLIENDDYKITIISSMNLNANKTCETFQIFTDEAVFDFYKNFVDTHFDNMKDGLERSGSVVSAVVREWFEENNKDEALNYDSLRTNWGGHGGD